MCARHSRRCLAAVSLSVKLRNKVISLSNSSISCGAKQDLYGFYYTFTNCNWTNNLELTTTHWISSLWQVFCMKTLGFFLKYSWCNYSQNPIWMTISVMFKWPPDGFMGASAVQFRKVGISDAVVQFRDLKMAVNWGAHRPRHYLVVRLMQGILRFQLWTRIRSRIFRAIFRPLTNCQLSFLSPGLM